MMRLIGFALSLPARVFRTGRRRNSGTAPARARQPADPGLRFLPWAAHERRSGPGTVARKPDRQIGRLSDRGHPHRPQRQRHAALGRDFVASRSALDRRTPAAGPDTMIRLVWPVSPCCPYSPAPPSPAAPVISAYSSNARAAVCALSRPAATPASAASKDSATCRMPRWSIRAISAMPTYSDATAV